MNLRLICERHLEVQKDVYICFLEYEKTVDRVRHELLMPCITEIGVAVERIGAHNGQHVHFLKEVCICAQS